MRKKCLCYVKIIIVILFLISTAWSYDWPFSPVTQQHGIFAFLGDLRGSGGTCSTGKCTRFHLGVDIPACNGTLIYAVDTGQVSFGSTSIIINNKHYIHYRSSIVRSGWFIVNDTTLTGQVFRNGRNEYPRHLPIAEVDDIGSTGCSGDHLHFQEGLGVANPLRSPNGLTPQPDDSSSPTITQIQIVKQSDGKPFPIKNDRPQVSGKFDIKIWAHDHVTGNVVGRTPYKVGYKIFDSSGNLKVGPIHHLQFDSVDGADVNLVYDIPNSSTSSPVFIATNLPSQDLSYNSSDLDDDTYSIVVLAEDIKGNIASKTIKIDVNNRFSSVDIASTCSGWVKVGESITITAKGPPDLGSAQVLVRLYNAQNLTDTGVLKFDFDATTQTNLVQIFSDTYQKVLYFSSGKDTSGNVPKYVVAAVSDDNFNARAYSNVVEVVSGSLSIQNAKAEPAIFEPKDGEKTTISAEITGVTPCDIVKWKVEIPGTSFSQSGSGQYISILWDGSGALDGSYNISFKAGLGTSCNPDSPSTCTNSQVVTATTLVQRGIPEAYKPNTQTWPSIQNEPWQSGSTSQDIQFPLRKKWTAGTGGPMAVGLGMVYVQDYYSLTAYNMDTGAVAWPPYNGSEAGASYNGVGGPALDMANKLVYFPVTKTKGGVYTTEVHALDALTGSLKWKETNPSGGYIQTITPLVAEYGNVYFGRTTYDSSVGSGLLFALRSNPSDPKGYKEAIRTNGNHCVDLRNGVCYNYEYVRRVPVAPKVVDLGGSEKVAAVQSEPFQSDFPDYFFNALTGAFKYVARFPTSAPRSQRFIATSDNLLGFDNDAKIYPPSNESFIPYPAVSASKVFISSYTDLDDTNNIVRVRAYNVSNGSLAWTYTTFGKNNNGILNEISPPVVANNTVFVITNEGLIGLSADAGIAIGKYIQPNEGWKQPLAVASGKIYASIGGNFYCFEHGEEPAILSGIDPTSFAYFSPNDDGYQDKIGFGFTLSKDATVQMDIHRRTIWEVDGETIYTGKPVKLPYGKNSFAWDGLDNNGNLAGEGTYVAFFYVGGKFAAAKSIVYDVTPPKVLNVEPGVGPISKEPEFFISYGDLVPPSLAGKSYSSGINTYSASGIHVLGTGFSDVVPKQILSKDYELQSGIRFKLLQPLVENGKYWITGILFDNARNRGYVTLGPYIVDGSVWPQLGGNESHTSSSDEVINPPLAVEWKSPIGTAGPTGAVASRAIVNNGSIYVVHNGVLQAFQENTGTKKWELPLAAGSMEFSSSPGYGSNNMIYVFGDGVLYAVKDNGSSVEKKWQVVLDASVRSPLVVGNTIYMTTSSGLYKVVDIGTSGTSQKMFSYIDPVSYTSPVIVNGKICFGLGDRLRILNLDGTGYVTFIAGGDIIHEPLIAYGNKVYLTESTSLWGSFLAFDVDQKVQVGGQGYEGDIVDDFSIAVHNGKVFVATQNGFLHAYDAGSSADPWGSTELWNVQMSGVGLSGGGNFLSNVIATKNYLYLLDSALNFYAVDYNGNVRWKNSFRGSYGMMGFVAGYGRLYFITPAQEEGKISTLYAFKQGGITYPRGGAVISIPMRNVTSIDPPLEALNLLGWGSYYWPVSTLGHLVLPRAYHAYFPSERKIKPQGEPVPDKPFSVYLQKGGTGWNLVPNPFLFNIYWDDATVRVYNWEEGFTKAHLLSEAINKGWIMNSGGLKVEMANKNVIIPPFSQIPAWKGFWVQASKDLRLDIYPVQSGQQTIIEKDWATEIELQINDMFVQAFLGDAPDAHDGYDNGYDYPETPALPEKFSRIYFPHTDSESGWDGHGGNYIREIKAPLTAGQIKRYDFEIHTDQLFMDASLSWKDISQVPANYKIFFVDKDEGKTTDMRNAQEYFFNTQNGLRRFQIIVADETLPEIQNVTVTPPVFSPNQDGFKDSTEISFVVTTPSTVEAKMFVAGSEDSVKTFTAQTSVNNEKVKLIWDGKSDSGNIVQDGSYVLKVTAKTQAGISSVEKQEKIVVDTTPPEIRKVYALNFSPNGDGVQDESLTYYTLNEDADVSYRVLTTDGAVVVKTLFTKIPKKQGENNETWDGKDEQENVVPDRDYNTELITEDVAGNKSPPVLVPVSVDTSRIDVTEVSVTNITRHNATISWSTSVPTDAQVQYGEDEIYGFYSDIDEVLSINHSLVLQGLKAGTTYHFTVRARNEKRTLSQTPDATFTTLPPLTGIVKINDDDTYTRPRDVTLSITPLNAQGVDITDVALSSDGVTFSEFSPYATILPFRLSEGGEDGERFVYVRIKDAEGEISNVFSDSIILDTTPPVTEQLTLEFCPKNKVAVRWNKFNDKFSGTAWYKLYRHTQPITDANLNSATFLQEFIQEQQSSFEYEDTVQDDHITYYYALRASDNVGNATGLVTNSIFVPDLTLPQTNVSLSAQVDPIYPKATLSWTPSTDNTQVTQYTLYRSMQPITSPYETVVEEDFESGVLSETKWLTPPQGSYTFTNGQLFIHNKFFLSSNAFLAGNTFHAIEADVDVTNSDGNVYALLQIIDQDNLQNGFAFGIKSHGKDDPSELVAFPLNTSAVIDPSPFETSFCFVPKHARLRMRYENGFFHFSYSTGGDFKEAGLLPFNFGSVLHYTYGISTLSSGSGNIVSTSFDNVSVHKKLAGPVLVSASKSSYLDEAVPPNKDIFYALTATDIEGNESLVSNVASTIYSDTESPASVSLIGEGASGPKAVLEWTPSSDNKAVSHYNVYRDTSPIASLLSTFPDVDFREEFEGASIDEKIWDVSNIVSSGYSVHLNGGSLVINGSSIGPAVIRTKQILDITTPLTIESEIDMLNSETGAAAIGITTSPQDFRPGTEGISFGISKIAPTIGVLGAFVLPQGAQHTSTVISLDQPSVLKIQYDGVDHWEFFMKAANGQFTKVDEFTFTLNPSRTYSLAMVGAFNLPSGGILDARFSYAHAFQPGSIRKRLPLTQLAYPAASFTDYTVSDTGTYYYAVTAMDYAGNESELSNPVTVEMDPLKPPSRVNLSVNVTSPTTADLTWDASTDNIRVLKYNVYRDKSPLSATAKDTVLFSDTFDATLSQWDVGAQPGIDVNINGSKQLVISGTSTTAGSSLALLSSKQTFSTDAPLVFETDHAFTGQAFSMGLFGGMEFGQNGASFLVRDEAAYVQTVQNGSGEQVFVKLLTPGSLHHYKIIVDRGTASYSIDDAFIGAYAVTLTSPKVVLGMGSVSSISTDEALFDNVKVTQLGKRMPIAEITHPASSFTDVDGVPGETFYYAVSAVDWAGNEGKLSDSQVATFTTSDDHEPPTAISDLQADLNNPTQVQLAWSGATDNVGVTRYVVYRLENQPVTNANKLFATILTKTLPSNTHTYADTTVQSGRTYYYAVTAFDAGGNESPLSNSPYVIVPAQNDTQPPAISINYPVDGSVINTKNITVQAALTDDLSGVDANSLALRADEVSVSFTFNPDTGVLTYLWPSNITDGLHAVTLEAKDKAGNVAQKVSSSFTVNAGTGTTIPPVISNVSPADKSFINLQTPTVTATITATGTTINAQKVFVKVDNVLLSSAYDMVTQTVTANVSNPLTNGTHTLKITALDNNGSAASLETQFTVDMIKPVVIITTPRNGSFLKDKNIVVRATLTDSGSGIDPSTLILKADDVVVSHSFDAATGILTYPWPPGITDGIHTVTLDAKDKAGNSAQKGNSIFVLDTVLPLVQNVNDAPDPISPGNSFGTKDATTISASIEDFNTDTWDLSITNPQNATVASTSGTGTDISYLWNGRDTSGAAVTDGLYNYTITAKDKAGNTSGGSQLSEQTVLQDNFDGGSIDTTKWTVSNQDSGLSVTQSNGKLRISGQPTQAGGSPIGNGVVSFTHPADSQKNFTASFDVDLSASVVSPNASVSANVVIGNPGAGSTALLQYFSHSSAQYEVRFFGQSYPLPNAYGTITLSYNASDKKLALFFNGVKKTEVDVTLTDGVFSFLAAGGGTQDIVDVRYDNFVLKQETVSGGTTSGTITVDNTNPDATLKILGAQHTQNEILFISGNTQLTIQGNDPVVNGVSSGIEKTQYAVDQQQALQDYAAPFTLAVGSHIVRSSATDAAGNSTNPPTFMQLVVDAMAPVTTLSPALQAFTKTKNVTLTANDPLTFGLASGVREIRYALDGALFTNYVSGITLSDGYHTVEYFSVDNVGNEEQHHTVTFTVDTTKPEVANISDAPDPFSPVASAGVKDTSTISASVTDANPDTWKLQLFDNANISVQTFNGSGGFISQLWNGSLSSGGTAPDGLYSYSLLATDKAGNTNKETSGGGSGSTTTLLSDDFNDGVLDSAKWNTNALPSDPGLTVTEEEGQLRIFGSPQAQSGGDSITGVLGTVFGDATKKLSVSVYVDVSHSQASPDGQPVASLVFLGSPAADAVLTMNVVLQGNAYILMYRTFSGQEGFLGNISAQGTITMQYDPSTSLIHVLFNGEEKGQVPMTLQDAALSILAATGGAGSFVDVRFDNFVFTQEEAGGGQVVFTPDGYITVDNTLPTSILTPSVALFNNQYASTSTTYLVTADDPIVNSVNSGIEKIEVAKDNEVFTTYSNAISLYEGKHTLKHKATDNAGNTEEAKTFAVDVDGTAPTTTLAPSAPLFNNVYAPLATTYALSATDPVSHDVSSGVLKTVYKIDGGAETQYSSAISLTEGEHTITYFSKDNVLNAEAEKTFTVKVDNTAPVTQIVPSSPLFANKYAPIATTYTFTATDTQSFGVASGVAKIEFTLDGGVTNTYNSNPISLTEGIHTFVFYATDNVGNKEEAKTFIVHVDNTLPVAQISVGTPQCTEDGKIIVNATTQFNITATDTEASGVTSGVKEIIYRIQNTEVRIQNNSGTFTLPANIPDGEVTIEFTASDNVENASTAQRITVVLDTTPPVAQILSPQYGSVISGIVSVMGTVTDSHFNTGNGEQGTGNSGGYTLSFGVGQNPTSFTTITSSTTQNTCTAESASCDPLGTWNTAGLTQDTQYTLKLTATDCVGNVSTAQALLRIGSPTVALSYGEKSTGQAADGTFDQPTGLAMFTGSDGRPLTLVADKQNHRIEVFNENGQFVAKFGTKSTGPQPNNGEFNEPTDIVVRDSGIGVREIYVVDSLNDRVQKFDKNYNFVAAYGSHGNAAGQFNKPYGIALDTEGNLYITDTQNNRVQKLDANGNFVKEWTFAKRTVNGNDETFTFNKPSGITLDAQGNLIVSDSQNDRVLKFAQDGTLLRVYASSGDASLKQPAGLTLDNSGNLYVADEMNHRVVKFDAFGNMVLTFGSKTQGNPAPEGTFNQVADVQLDATQKFLLVSDIHNNRIQVFALTVNAPPLAKVVSQKNDDKNTIISDPNLLNVLRVFPYPSPTHGKMSFNLEAEGNVTDITLEVYTINGKRILTEYLPLQAATGAKGKGKYKADSPSLDAAIESLPNGVYVYRLQISNGIKTVNKTGKFVVVK